MRKEAHMLIYTCIILIPPLFPPVDGALPIPQERLWLPGPAFWFKPANGSTAENKRIDMIPGYISLFPSNCGLVTNWNQSVSHMCCVSLLWLNWLTFTPGVKINLCYTLLNWISFPNRKSSADCQAHLLSFSLFTPQAMWKWWVQGRQFALYFTST